MSQFEVLVINDGSKDRTSKIAHTYEQKYPQTFRVIDKENGHYGSCVNRGLAEANGTFVKVLDADDAFDKNAFLQFLPFLNEASSSGAEMVLSDYANVDNESQIEKVIHFSNHKGLYSLSDLTENDKYIWFIHGITYRLSVLLNSGYRQTEGLPYSDLEWSICPLTSVNSILKYDKVLYLYTIGRDGQSVSPEIHNKNLHLELLIKRGIIQQLPSSSLDSNNGKDSFIFDRICILVNYLYQDYIFSKPHFSFNDNDLLSFDVFLKQFPNIYTVTNQYSTILSGGSKFQPIKDWRDKNIRSLTIQKILYNCSSFRSKLRKR